MKKLFKKLMLAFICGVIIFNSIFFSFNMNVYAVGEAEMAFTIYELFESLLISMGCTQIGLEELKPGYQFPGQQAAEQYNSLPADFKQYVAEQLAQGNSVQIPELVEEREALTEWGKVFNFPGSGGYQDNDGKILGLTVTAKMIEVFQKFLKSKNIDLDSGNVVSNKITYHTKDNLKYYSDFSGNLGIFFGDDAGTSGHSYVLNLSVAGGAVAPYVVHCAKEEYHYIPGLVAYGLISKEPFTASVAFGAWNHGGFNYSEVVKMLADYDSPNKSEVSPGSAYGYYYLEWTIPESYFTGFDGVNTYISDQFNVLGEYPYFKDYLASIAGSKPSGTYSLTALGGYSNSVFNGLNNGLNLSPSFVRDLIAARNNAIQNNIVADGQLSENIADIVAQAVEDAFQKHAAEINPGTNTGGGNSSTDISGVLDGLFKILSTITDFFNFVKGIPDKIFELFRPLIELIPDELIHGFAEPLGEILAGMQALPKQFLDLFQGLNVHVLGADGKPIEFPKILPIEWPDIFHIDWPDKLPIEWPESFPLTWPDGFPDIPILQDILTAIQAIPKFFVLDIPAIKTATDEALDGVGDHTGLTPVLATFEGLHFADNYEYPKIVINTPRIIRQFYDEPQIVLLDFKDYAEYMMWARLIFRVTLWFAFLLWAVREFKVSYHIA